MNADKLIVDIVVHTEYLETTEMDTVPCISIENLIGILQEHKIITQTEGRKLQEETQ